MLYIELQYQAKYGSYSGIQLSQSDFLDVRLNSEPLLFPSVRDYTTKYLYSLR